MKIFPVNILDLARCASETQHLGSKRDWLVEDCDCGDEKSDGDWEGESP